MGQYTTEVETLPTSQHNIDIKCIYMCGCTVHAYIQAHKKVVHSGKSSLVSVWTTVFTTVTPKGNCQNVDYDDDDHNETDGCCIPGGDK